MAYQFVNRTVGKTGIKITGTTTEINLPGINTTSNDANKLMNALTLLLGIVSWTMADVNRVVTQDVEETT